MGTKWWGRGVINKMQTREDKNVIVESVSGFYTLTAVLKSGDHILPTTAVPEWSYFSCRYYKYCK